MNISLYAAGTDVCFVMSASMGLRARESLYKTQGGADICLTMSAKFAAANLRCVLGMLSSLEVKVLWPT